MPDQAAAAEPRQLHPLIHAGSWLLADLLSTLAFVALYAISHSVYTATGLAIALGLGQIAVAKFRRTPIDIMQWLSLFLVVVFGGATLITHNPVFVKLKPTLIYLAIGTVMLKPGWMLRYMPPLGRTHAGDVTFVFGHIWAGMMFATAAANVGLAFAATTQQWAWFVGIFPIASKLTLFFIQYGVTRFIVRRRIVASRAAAPAAA